MTILDLMEKRRSIRAYRRALVPQEAVEKVLRAGSLAPSGANQQPWLLIVVSDSDLKAAIRTESERVDSAWHRDAPAWLQAWLKSQNINQEKPFLEEVPYLICIFGHRGKPYWLESCWIAIAYMLLAAQEEGLGTLTYTPGSPAFLRELLEVPPDFEPVALLPLGYPAEEPDGEKRGRKPLEKVVYWNKYQ